MTVSTVLVATWRDGLFVVSAGTRDQELANRSVRALAPDGRGGALAIIDRRSLYRRAPDGVWSTMVTAGCDLACCVTVGAVVYAGTGDAHVLHVSGGGEIEQLRGFERVAGRDQWHAGRAMRNSKRVGPTGFLASLPELPQAMSPAILRFGRFSSLGGASPS